MSGPAYRKADPVRGDSGGPDAFDFGALAGMPPFARWIIDRVYDRVEPVTRGPGMVGVALYLGDGVTGVVLIPVGRMDDAALAAVLDTIERNRDDSATRSRSCVGRTER